MRPTNQRDEARKRLERDVEAFLAKGKAIRQVPTGQGAESDFWSLTRRQK